MEPKKHIDQEVEKTLHALDGLQRARTDDFFYSRLQAKVENRSNSFEIQHSPEFGFALSVAAVALILILNVTSMLIYGNHTASDETRPIVNYEEELMADYQVFDLSYYTEMEE